MKRFIFPLLTALGIAACGFFIYLGIAKFADKDRCVTVKGLSEREVLANRVTWPMSVSVSGMQLDPLYGQLEEKQNEVIKFLKDNGINEDEITVSSPDITDYYQFQYEECIKKNWFRYTVKSDVTVTTGNVKKVMSLLKKQLELRQKGIDVSTEDYSLQYEYVDLTSVKPEMVEEATKDARKVAEKFAKDANCSLGSIMNATQGQFTIEDNYHRPQYKNIRVVTTISYYLK